MFDRIKKFFGEVRQELRHVNWPTREEAIRLTAIVIGISIGLALFLGLFDFIFAGAVKNIVLRGVPAEQIAAGDKTAATSTQENTEVPVEATIEPTSTEQ